MKARFILLIMLLNISFISANFQQTNVKITPKGAYFEKGSTINGKIVSFEDLELEQLEKMLLVN